MYGVLQRFMGIPYEKEKILADTGYHHTVIYFGVINFRQYKFAGTLYLYIVLK